ncbi:MAG: cold shock domain-containing protein [Thermoplasmatota archaeon]
MKGIVKWYNIRRGYGFVRGEDGKSAFVHKNSIPFWNIYLSAGEKVQYDIEQSKRGLEAKNLKTL